MRLASSHSVRSPVVSRGTIMLLALLVLSSVTVAAGGLGSLILNSLQQSRLVDSATVAYYAAESGAEDALYRLRRDDAIPGTYDVGSGLYLAGPTLMPNGASWRREISGSEAMVVTDILEDSFVEFLLYDPDNAGQPLPDPIQTLVVSWAPQVCDAASCPRLVVSRVSWDAGAISWNDDGAWTKLFSVADAPATIDMTPAIRLHKLRLRAEGADFRDVRVEAFDFGSNPVALPGRARIDSWGSFGESQQRLVVRVPRSIPLGGAFDYALFSECSIVKGFPIRCP